MKALSPDQFADWAEFYSVEPFGLEIQDQMIANVIAAIYKAQGAKNVHTEDFSITARLNEAASEPDNQEFATKLAAALGAKEESHG